LVGLYSAFDWWNDDGVLDVASPRWGCHFEATPGCTWFLDENPIQTLVERWRHLWCRALLEGITS
jgi:hypothetical protein